LLFNEMIKLYLTDNKRIYLLNIENH